MNLHDYPEQEPLSDFGRKHFLGMARRNAMLVCEEHAYGEGAQRRLLHFATEKPGAPLLVFFHGGGWTNGYKEYAAFMGPLFAQAGISFVTAGYRLAPEYVFPAGFDDVADAVAWCCSNQDKLGIDARKVFVGGFSAGAHYASLLATRSDWQASRGLPRSVLAGCLSISGSYLFGPDAGFSMRPRFLGDAALGNDAQASPLLHAHRHVPPFHVAYGSEDFPHLVVQGRNFCARLRELDGSVVELELPGRDHLGSGYAAGEFDGPWFASARAFIDADRRGGEA